MEEAVEYSHSMGLWHFEILALRDLEACARQRRPRRGGHPPAAEGVLKEMKGPPTELTKLLGESLDAEAILRS